MKLSGRLEMIAERIPPCRILSDIGTDHAYLPIYAVENGLCEHALASDLRTGPLETAAANIRKHGLESRVEVRLGNGLEPILPEECDVIVIAGMGGLLIRDILSSSYEKASRATLLLQANNAVDSLRKWLYGSGFDITEEKLVRDAGKLYCVIKAGWTGASAVKDEFAYYIGERIFKGNDALLRQYLQKKLRELEVIIEGRKRSDPRKERCTGGDGAMETETCMRIRDRLAEYLEDS